MSKFAVVADNVLIDKYVNDELYESVEKDITSKTIKMLNSVNMINIFVEMINKLRRNLQTEV